MKNLLLTIFLLGSFFLPKDQLTSNQPSSNEWVDLSNVNTSYSFGQQVDFYGEIQTESSIESIFLFIEPYGQDTLVQNIPFDQSDKITYSLNLDDHPLRAFADITYWFRIVSENNQEFNSKKFTFFYGDNQFDWMNLENDLFSVYWTKRDIEFGQNVLNTARTGIESAEKYIPISLVDSGIRPRIKIYVYENAKDLQNALQLSSTASWVAGHASPDLRTLLVSIPSGPEQQLELERQIPHEVAHILQYQFADEKLNDLPIWWIEGTASLAELYPNADYSVVLDKAASEESLLSISSLTEQFPRDASNAFLAYAESVSFCRYLYHQYGKEKVTLLMVKYMDGMGWEEGAQDVLGASLSEIENDWQQKELGVNLEALALKNLSPYMLLFFIILLPPLSIGVRGLRKKKS